MGNRRSIAALAFANTCAVMLAAGQTDTDFLPQPPTIEVLQPRNGLSSGNGVTFYVNQEGRRVLTNRHEAYRNDPEFMEVHVKLRAIVVPGRYKFYESAKDYSDSDVSYLVRRYARMYGLPESLVYAVIEAESAFNPYAVSVAGARGLMQLMPGTAAEMRVKDVFDPAQNIAGGTQYLSQMLSTFGGDLDLALAGYNAGPAAVIEHDGIPPYAETKNYVAKVKRLEEQYRNNNRKPHLAKAGDRPSSGFLPRREYPITVYFEGGITQPADKIDVMDEYYVVSFQGRNYSVLKELVQKIERNA